MQFCKTAIKKVSKIVTGNQNKVNDAAWNLSTSVRESNQAIVDSVVSAQERNMKFAQNIFLSWIDLLTQQTESMQHLQQQWGQQIQTQRDTFQRLASTSMQIYMDFFLAPFSFSRRLVDETEDAMRKERESARKASRSDLNKS